uniref:Uncharacterized protein n=1 Tax=Sipha flava TaxID=143950 RepID=A0A2S2QBL4_9HEMI
MNAERAALSSDRFVGGATDVPSARQLAQPVAGGGPTRVGAGNAPGPENPARRDGDGAGFSFYCYFPPSSPPPDAHRRCSLLARSGAIKRKKLITVVSSVPRMGTRRRMKKKKKTALPSNYDLQLIYF